MAITIQQQAYTKQKGGSEEQKDVQPVYTPAVFVVSSTKTGELNHRYIADVYIQNTKVARLKFTKNSSDRGMVDVTQILIDYCNAQILGYDNNGSASGSSTKNGIPSYDFPHSIHQIDKYSRNDASMIDWYVLFGEEYQLSDDEPPLIYNGSGDVEGDPALATNSFQSFNSVLNQYEDLMFKSIVPYILSSSSNVVNSSLDYVVNRKIRIDDYHTLCVFNGTNQDGNVSRPDRMNVRTYGPTGSQLQFFQVLNTNANGGSPYGATINNGVENLLFVGCGPKNFANSLTPISPNAVYYTLQFVQGGVGRSRLYRFDIDECDEDTERFKKYRLTWLNKFGGWDYFNFDMKSEKSFDMERQTYMTTRGTWQDDQYFFQQGEFGVTDFNVDARQKLKLQSDWLVDGEVEMIRELFFSPRVHLLDGEDVFPVNVQATNFIQYKQKEDKVFQYELEVTFSHKHRVQNG